MKVGNYVVIKEARGAAGWVFGKRRGHITEVDNYCYTVRTDDGETIRDVREHFKLYKG